MLNANKNFKSVRIIMFKVEGDNLVEEYLVKKEKWISSKQLLMSNEQQANNRNSRSIQSLTFFTINN